jgi:hypothetical protein
MGPRTRGYLPLLGPPRQTYQGQPWGKNIFWIKTRFGGDLDRFYYKIQNRAGITYFPGFLAIIWNEDEDEDEDDGPVNITRALRGDDVPTEAFETAHQSIYRYYVFYHVFYYKKRV